MFGQWYLAIARTRHSVLQICRCNSLFPSFPVAETAHPLHASCSHWPDGCKDTCPQQSKCKYCRHRSKGGRERGEAQFNELWKKTTLKYKLWQFASKFSPKGPPPPPPPSLCLYSTLVKPDCPPPLAGLGHRFRPLRVRCPCQPAEREVAQQLRHRAEVGRKSEGGIAPVPGEQITSGENPVGREAPKMTTPTDTPTFLALMFTEGRWTWPPLFSFLSANVGVTTCCSRPGAPNQYKFHQFSIIVFSVF